MRWYHFLIIIILAVLGTVIYKTATPSPVTDGHDLIAVDYPTTNTPITSPLVITGRARGTWFFEASFPVTLVNWDGLIIAEGYAQAKSDWMTTDYVPFEATLNFTNPAGEQNFTHRGALILRKDNPSGLPANDASLEISVRFK